MEGGDSIIGIQFPPGFRFHPTDQELIIHYLSKKIASSLPPASSIIADIDLYKFNPWELPEKAIFGEGEWFFFSPRDRKYPNGVRPNRAAACGYWKATGTDKPILATGGTQCLGVKKALIFYKGRPPKGIKTDWVMHEYRLLESNSPVPFKHKGTMRLDDWVLCRVRRKGALLPENDGGPMQSSPTVFGHDKQPPPQQQEQLFVGKEGSNLLELSDCQLMGYLLGSASEAESAGESSGLLHGHGFFGAQHQQELVSSMLSSTKRTKLSFGALDELMLVPGKRIFPFSAGEHLSPAESGSEDDGCLEFLL